MPWLNISVWFLMRGKTDDCVCVMLSSRHYLPNRGYHHSWCLLPSRFNKGADRNIGYPNARRHCRRSRCNLWCGNDSRVASHEQRCKIESKDRGRACSRIRNRRGALYRWRVLHRIHPCARGFNTRHHVEGARGHPDASSTDVLDIALR